MRQYKASKAEVAAIESTDPTELDALADHHNKFIRSRVAKNRATGGDTLARLARDEDDYVRSAVARHANTPAETLAAMSAAGDASKYVRSALAANPRTPAAALVPTDADDHFTRKSLARNPNAPAEVLRALATDRDTTIVEELAMNPATPDDVVLSLITHWSSTVASAIARRNPDPNPTRWRTITVTTRVGRGYVEQPKRIPVERGGRFTPEQIEAMAVSPHRPLRLAAASQPDAPHAVLAALAADEDMWIRVRVMENEGTPAALLIQMAQNETEARIMPMLANRSDLPGEAIIAIAARKVRNAHKALPSHTIETLLAHEDPIVRASAARVAREVSGEDAEVWERLFADDAKEVRVAAANACPASVLNQQASHTCKHVRAVVADLTHDPAVLFSLVNDTEVTVRRRVVKNTGCPAEAMMALARDPDQRVRTHAAGRFMDAMLRTPGSL
jgi:hypothetical protein